jgi:hypothetical protein
MRILGGYLHYADCKSNVAWQIANIMAILAGRLP